MLIMGKYMGENRYGGTASMVSWNFATTETDKSKMVDPFLTILDLGSAVNLFYITSPIKYASMLDKGILIHFNGGNKYTNKAGTL